MSLGVERGTRDPRLDHAIQVIQSTYGDSVSVEAKKKDLLKFGGITSTDGTAEQTIANFQGSTLRETYATSNSIDKVVCDGTFTGTVTVEGHTISGGNLTFVIQTKTLTSTTPATLDTPLARATRVYVNGSAALPSSSNVYVYDSSVAASAPSGIPNVASATKVTCDDVELQSEKCATSVSSTDYWIVTGFYAAVFKKTNASAIIRLRHGDVGNLLRTRAPKLFLDSDGTATDQVIFDPYLIIPKNNDVELTIKASASGVQVSGGINGYLAKVI